MKMKMIRVLGPCLVAAALAACGGDDDDASFDTVGDVAQALSESLCGALDDCDSLGDTTVNECVDQLVSQTCGQVDCEAPVASDVSDDDINQCLDDIDNLSCDSEDLPASCSF